MFPCRHFSSAGKPKLNTCVSILYVSVDVNIESEVIFPKPWRNINNKLGFFFMCFITLLMTRTQSTFFCNWTNPSLCNDWPFCPSSYSETERAIWSLHVLALVMWHHVPLYCDVVSGGEEMKCLEAMWETCVCVCPRACTWWGFRRKSEQVRVYLTPCMYLRVVLVSTWPYVS